MWPLLLGRLQNGSALSPPSVITGQFGFTNDGGSSNVTIAAVGSKFTAPAGNGHITDLQMYVPTYTGTPGHARGAVYSDNAGTPDLKIAESSEITISSTGWKTLPLTCAFSASAVLWLMLWKDSVDTYMAYSTPGDVPNQSAYSITMLYPSWGSSFDFTSFIDWKVSIYANYTLP